jgi:hypothetical protein
MKSVVAALAVLGFLPHVVGCGGELSSVGSGADGSDASVASDSSAEDAGTPDAPRTATDAMTTSDAELEASLTCSSTSSVGDSSGTCLASVTETCSDGTTYIADCSCPRATCSCFEMNGASGGGTGGLPYGGCPIPCGDDVMSPTAATDALRACGYPVP